MDQGYASIGGSDGNERYTDFGHSLTVVASVYSKPADDIAIVDAGLKSFATDSGGVPQSISHPQFAYAWAGDEHGRIDMKGASALNLGDRVEFTVPHCDPTSISTTGFGATAAATSKRSGRSPRAECRNRCPWMSR
jgi:D-serine deaminase-like pyridoxal phosphate-dependent protein